MRSIQSRVTGATGWGGVLCSVTLTLPVRKSTRRFSFFPYARMLQHSVDTKFLRLKFLNSNFFACCAAALAFLRTTAKIPKIAYMHFLFEFLMDAPPLFRQEATDALASQWAGSVVLARPVSMRLGALMEMLLTGTLLMRAAIIRWRFPVPFLLVLPSEHDSRVHSLRMLCAGSFSR